MYYTLMIKVQWMYLQHSPTLGAHTHAHGFWVGMGAILLVMLQFWNTRAQFETHGWAWVVFDGCGLGMGTNSKEMLGSNLQSRVRRYVFEI